MSPIKRLNTKDYKQMVDIAANAYPGFEFDTPEMKERVRKMLLKDQKTDPAVNHYGLYRQNELIAGLRMFDFKMTLFQTKANIGGGGFLAVDLTRKKEKAAKEIMEFFINHYRKREFPLATLYPFRPDFYRRMGFGYGTKTNEYIFKPADLPKGSGKKHIRHLTKKDRPAITACYNRYASGCHGMFQKCQYEINRLFNPQNKIIGFKKGRKLEGYMVFNFEKNEKPHFLNQSLRITQMIWNTREAFGGLMAFLNSQADQVGQIMYGTQDEHLHFLPFDPRNQSDRMVPIIGHETNRQGVGIMYRVLNMLHLFENLKKHNFNGQTCRMKIFIRDSFYKDIEGGYIVHFENGHADLKLRGKHDVQISLDISDFSSLVLGVVDFESLYDYGLAEISDLKYLETVNRTFLSEKKPITMTQF
jgi:predicted acetyltransferase